MSTMNAALKGMKLLQQRIPHKKKIVEPIKQSRYEKGGKEGREGGDAFMCRHCVLRIAND